MQDSFWCLFDSTFSSDSRVKLSTYYIVKVSTKENNNNSQKAEKPIFVLSQVVLGCPLSCDSKSR